MLEMRMDSSARMAVPQTIASSACPRSRKVPSTPPYSMVAVEKISPIQMERIFTQLCRFSF